MIALIDGDVIVYRTGFASEGESESIACVRANKTIEDILHETGATEYQVWFSDRLENNFRYQIDKNYKSSRQSQPKPKHYSSLKSFLTKEWGAQVTPNQEADDILGIEQTSGNRDYHETMGGQLDPFTTIICTTDKDLKQVPGMHWNFVKKELSKVSYSEGLLFFYSQLLIGDRVDDIQGIYGLGPKKTAKLLNDLETEQELFKKVQEIYQDDERLLKNGRLLWIRRKENELWEFPKINEASIQDESGEYSDTVDGHSDGDQTSSGVLLLR